MKNIKNNILYKNILILLITGSFAKIIGMLSKIIYTRISGFKVVSLYTLIIPTLMLIIGIISFSFPISISKLSAEEKYDNNSLLKNAYLIGFIIDIIVIIILLFTDKYIANLLNNKALYKSISSITLIIPFITITSIQRGFLHGKEDMMLPSILNIVEEIIKILLIVLILPITIKKSNIKAVSSLILFNIITELISLIFLSKKINKKYINKKGYINKKIINEIVSISLPTTLIRLIQSFGFFLEPIILTNLLIYKGYNNLYITNEYAAITSYIIPILQIPSFFTLSISSALLPNITKLYKEKKNNEFKTKLIKLLIISLIIGICYIIFLLLFPKKILYLIYKNTYGINYLYLIAPVFIFLYIQPSLTAAIQASGNTNKLLKISIITIICKYSFLSIFCLFNKGIYSLLYSIMIGIILTSFLEIKLIIKKMPL